MLPVVDGRDIDPERVGCRLVLKSFTDDQPNRSLFLSREQPEDRFEALGVDRDAVRSGTSLAVGPTVGSARLDLEGVRAIPSGAFEHCSVPLGPLVLPSSEVLGDPKEISDSDRHPFKISHSEKTNKRLVDQFLGLARADEPSGKRLNAMAITEVQIPDDFAAICVSRGLKRSVVRPPGPVVDRRLDGRGWNGWIHGGSASLHLGRSAL